MGESSQIFRSLTSVGDYSVSRIFSQQSCLATDSTDRMVVLKALASDCMLDGMLHPGIADRMARVRELAHTGVANLYAVELHDDRAIAVWEYMAGKTFCEYANQLDSPDQLLELGRRLIQSVDAMHALGIVHGAIRDSNVFVDDFRQIRLTHVSPLLYDDPRIDAEAVVKLLAQAVKMRDWNDTPVGRMVDDATRSTVDLSPLRGMLATEPRAEIAEKSKESSPRRASLFFAVVVTIVAIGLAIFLWQFGQEPAPSTMNPATHFSEP